MKCFMNGSECQQRKTNELDTGGRNLRNVSQTLAQTQILESQNTWNFTNTVYRTWSTGWLKKWTQFVSLYGFMAPQHTPDSWLRYSKFSARSTGWLAWATLKTLFNSSHLLLWYTWSAGAFAFTQTALFAQIGDSKDKCSSSLQSECWNEEETHAVQ